MSITPVGGWSGSLGKQPDSSSKQKEQPPKQTPPPPPPPPKREEPKASKQRGVYVIRGGDAGEDEPYVLEHNLALIQFKEFGSLEGLGNWEELSRFVRESAPSLNAHAAGNLAAQLWTFTLGMQEGDFVILPQKLSPQVAIGVVAGPYKFQKIGAEYRHTRPVRWMRSNIPRNDFRQDLLLSLNASMACYRVGSGEAEPRVAAMLDGKSDPGISVAAGSFHAFPASQNATFAVAPEEMLDLEQTARDQIVKRIEERFKEHEMAGLVNAVLRAEGWITHLFLPGQDGGGDILAGRGSLGMDPPRLVVQVKHQRDPVDVKVYRELIGAVQSFQADQGLLVCWGGFTRALRNEARQHHFAISLWDQRDLVEALLEVYAKLPAEIRTELPLKQVWMVVPDDSGI